MPVDNLRQQDVALALNPLIEGSDPGVRDAGMAAIQQWGTLQDNADTLKKVARCKDPAVAATAQGLLNKLN